MKPWQEIKIPGELARVRSMLAHEEKQYLQWLTATLYEGWGAVIDLGPWLGGSTAALAEGLKQQGRTNKIVSLDLFEWEPTYMQDVADEDLQAGDDFLPVFTRETAHYADWVDVHKCDLLNYSWTGGVIEILFVDAGKSWDLTNAILKAFGPSLIPGRSRVVLQDFRHYTTPWLPLIFGSRPDLWAEAESVDDGWTVTFTPLKALDGPDGIREHYSETTFPYSTAAALFKARIKDEGPKGAQLLLAGLYRLVLADGSNDDVAQVREELRRGHTSEDELIEIAQIDHVLLPRGWGAYVRHEYETARMYAERSLSATGHRSPYILALLGMSLLRLGDVKGAKACIDEVVASEAPIPSTKLYRAEVALADGRPHDARRDALDVLQLGPSDDTIVEYALGVMAQVDGILAAQGTVEALSQVAARFQKNATFLAHLANAHYRAGEKAKAKSILATAAKLSATNPGVVKFQSLWATT